MTVSRSGKSYFTNPLLIATILALFAVLTFLSFKVSSPGIRDFFSASPSELDSAVSPSGISTNINITIDDTFFTFKEFFQEDLGVPNPQFDTQKLKTYTPKNWKGKGRPTYAAYLSTRSGSVHDPYFCGAQQLVYRVLWDPRSRTKDYPFTVFVAPFIPQEQRDILAAAGAYVKELPLVEWHSSALVNGRWRDLFSKLNVWNETSFSRILLLDTDAFPLANVDDIFDPAQAPELTCNHTLLNADDRNDPELDEMCSYVYSGIPQAGMGFDQINGGVYVLKPSIAMHRRLMREMAKDDFDDNLAEQAFLNVAFRDNGPFPAFKLGRQWNGFVPQEDEEGKLKIIHDKLWMMDRFTDRNLSWALNYFNDTWDDMVKLYESDGFEKMRAADRSSDGRAMIG